MGKIKEGKQEGERESTGEGTTLGGSLSCPNHSSRVRDGRYTMHDGFEDLAPLKKDLLAT